MGKSVTKGGTLMLVIGLVIGLFWVWGWIEGIPEFSPQAHPLGLVLASLSLGALFTALLWGLTAIMDKTYNFPDVARAWNTESSIDLPPLPEFYPSVTVDTSTVLRTHRFERERYIKTGLQGTVAALLIGAIGFAWVLGSRLTMESAESNKVFVVALFAVFAIVLGPVIVAIGVWAPRYVSRHRMDVHPGGVTVYKAFGSTTFENSAATLKYHAKGLVSAHFLIDRVTGARAMVWNLEGSSQYDFGYSEGALGNIVELEEPDSRVRSLMPLTVTQPVLISVLFLWYVCTIAAVAAILTT